MNTMTGASPQSVSSRYVCPLDAPVEQRDPGSVGGKAHNLARMTRLGFPVPPGFAVTRAALDEVLRYNDLTGRISALAQGAGERDPAGLQRASAAIRAL